jgi:signal transduction histidine kinase
MNTKASSIKSNQNAEANSFNKLYGWRRFFFKTQTLILLWYVVLTVLSTTAFTLTIRYLFLVRLEQRDAIFIVNWVSIAVLTVAFLLAWLTSKPILNPLRLLTESARSISKIDLSRRIPVQGTNEVAELTITLNNMLARLQAAFASQQDFLNDASHELQTPITIIRCHLDLLGNDLQEWLETKKFIIDELDCMSRIVNDLLLLAKLEQPNFLTLEILDVSSLTEDLYTKVKTIANRNWCLDAKASGRIITDRHRLTQAVINLARNAAQHTIDDDVIGLGSAFTDSGARFWVRDTGKGIDPGDQHRIFERFVRAANDGSHSEGTGLGLAIVRKIAEAHGGRVEVFSRLGAGSTFTVVIPLDVS